MYPVDEDAELTARFQTLQKEMEAEEHARLLGIEDAHLLALKEELEELRRGMQEDLTSVENYSGRSTPVETPTRARNIFCFDDALSEPRSPLVGTPSPRSSMTQDSRMPLHSHTSPLLTPSTSGTVTPLTPRSPSGTNFSSSDEISWLSVPTEVSEIESRPEVAVAPPVPPPTITASTVTIDAALRAGLESGGIQREEWENEEEWLVKTEAKEEIILVHPLPKVIVPRLNLPSSPGTFGSSRNSARGGPVTISARGGIGSRPKTARGQPTSRLGGGGGGGNITPRPQPTPRSIARPSSSPNISVPSPPNTNAHSPLQPTPRLKRTSRSPSPVSNVPAPPLSARGPAPPLSARGQAPELFRRPVNLTVKKEAPTPRLVPLASLESSMQRSASTKSLSSGSDGEQQTFVKLANPTPSPPASKIPRLQLPLT